ncbi:MAG: ectonucleotide pyrophosphatase/phosphodiesterase [Telluria sp.]|nr:ectonucleotide pyrophosphatase/phosphodiesterase [Telluria sp.]
MSCAPWRAVPGRAYFFEKLLMKSFFFLRLFAVVFALTASGCASLPGCAPVAPVILVSIDGFKPEYLQRGITPRLSRFAALGVRAEAMRPSFPTVTFPNHYTLVTGLHPDRHGIVGNTMEDPAIPGVRFSLGNKEAQLDRRWWDQAEPVWVTAEKNQVRTAIMFWPGSEAPIHGVRPGDYRKYDGKRELADRVDTLLSWLERPAGTRPGFLALYFEDIDEAGHAYGPDSPELAAALGHVDLAIGRLLDGLGTRGVAANIVIVSDHGMANTSAERVVRLPEVAPPDSYRLITYGPYAGLEAVAGKEAVLAAALLRQHEHMQCWRKDNLPARFHFGKNPRVPQFICLAETGWVIRPADVPGRPMKSAGGHGFDQDALEMQALFLAAGPGFRQGTVLKSLEAVDVYPLLMKLLALPALPSDGSLNATAPALR